MRLTLLLLFSVANVLACFGCGGQNRPVLPAKARAGFFPDGPEWAIPVPEMRAPVPIADYTPLDRSHDLDVTSEAVKRFLQADRLKSEGQYQEAEVSYARALELQPDFAYAAYQRSCNFALSGRVAEAQASFDRAIELGFSDYPMAYHDDELGEIRSDAGFPDKLRKIRNNYLKEMESRTGTPVVFYPETAERAPLMVLLHGFGDTHESYFDHARDWARLGFVVVALPGSVPSVTGGLIWSQDSIETTHQQIQAVARSPLVSEWIIPQRLFTLGFSQGALHAFQALLMHPEQYSGVVAISPGGRPWALAENFTPAPGPKPSVWFVSGAEEPIGPFVEHWTKQCQQAGWRVEATKHPGGHTFPEDWKESQQRVATFLLEPTPN